MWRKSGSMRAKHSDVPPTMMESVAIDRGLPRARHRRIGEGRRLAFELRIEPRAPS